MARKDDNTRGEYKLHVDMPYIPEVDLSGGEGLQNYPNQNLDRKSTFAKRVMAQRRAQREEMTEAADIRMLALELLDASFPNASRKEIAAKLEVLGYSANENTVTNTRQRSRLSRLPKKSKGADHLDSCLTLEDLKK